MKGAGFFFKGVTYFSAYTGPVRVCEHVPPPFFYPP